MTVQIVGIRQSGTNHATITHYQWRQDGQTGIWSKPDGVAWVRKYPGQAVTSNGVQSATVHVVESGPGAPYLQTRADNSWTNNLLYLPRF